MPDIMLDIRIIVFLIIVGVLGYLGWEWHEKDVKIQQDQITIEHQQAAVVADQTVIKQTTQSDAVTQSVNTDAAKAQQAAQQKQTGIVRDTAAKTTVIKNKYADLPQTPTNEDARISEVSNVQLDGVWASYCATSAGANDTANCPGATPAPAPQPEATPAPNIITDPADPPPATAPPAADKDAKPEIKLPSVPDIIPSVIEKAVGI